MTLHYNFFFYALGAGAIALMFGWDKIVAWLDKLDPNSPPAGWAASQRIYGNGQKGALASTTPEMESHSHQFGSGGATRGSQPARRGHCTSARAGRITVGRQSGPLPPAR